MNRRSLAVTLVVLGAVALPIILGAGLLGLYRGNMPCIEQVIGVVVAALAVVVGAVLRIRA